MLVPAKPEDQKIIQNMAQFYVYDINCANGPRCHWPLEQDGRYFAMQSLPSYWQDPDKLAFLVKMNDELAGFILMQQKPHLMLNEFFILRPFQQQGLGKQTAFELFNRFPGTWELMVMCENLSAYHFWKHILSEYTGNQFSEVKKMIPFKGNEYRFVFTFESLGKPALFQ